jgi:[ribosomal protein S18]-alanine N-acetyltransferase
VPIRSAVSSDLDALVALEEKCFTSDRLSRSSLRRFLSVPNAAVLVVVHRGVTAGYSLVAFRKGSQIARLYSIAVDPAFRGRNFGFALLKESERTAQARGATVMRLEVRIKNRRAIALYEGRGYRRFDRIADYYEDGAGAYCYEKPLDKGKTAKAGLK